MSAYDTIKRKMFEHCSVKKNHRVCAFSWRRSSELMIHHVFQPSLDPQPHKTQRACRKCISYNMQQIIHNHQRCHIFKHIYLLSVILQLSTRCPQTVLRFSSPDCHTQWHTCSPIPSSALNLLKLFHPPLAALRLNHEFWSHCASF